MGLMSKAILKLATKGGRRGGGGGVLPYLLGGGLFGGLSYMAYRQAKKLEKMDEAEAKRRRDNAKENLRRQGKIVKDKD